MTGNNSRCDLSWKHPAKKQDLVLILLMLLLLLLLLLVLQHQSEDPIVLVYVPVILG